jgi:hypothetical protein
LQLGGHTVAKAMKKGPLRGCWAMGDEDIASVYFAEGAIGNASFVSLACRGGMTGQP